MKLTRVWLGLFLASLAFLPVQAAEPPAWIDLTPKAQADLKMGKYPLLGRLDTILQNLVEVRQLPVKTPIKVDTLSREELMVKLQENIAKSISDEQIEGEKALYVRWNMLQPEFDYKKFILELYTEQIGGFYDPDTKMLYLVKDVPVSKLELEMLVAHELTHALQDQHFDLKRLLENTDNAKNDDQILAQMALVEGDATLASVEYLQNQTQKSGFSFLEILGSVANLLRMQQTFQKLQAAPAFIRATMLFPYEEGMRFVSHFRQVKGWSWDELETLYQTPPRSTEMILKPAKYLLKEVPQTFSFSALEALPQGTVRLLNGVMGELVWQQFFRQHLKRRAADAVATGWNGDFFEVLRLPDQRYILNLRTSWDSKQDAQEFLEAYQTAMYKRYPNAQKLQDNHYQLSPSEEARIHLDGREVSISEGFSAQDKGFQGFLSTFLAPRQ